MKFKHNTKLVHIAKTLRKNMTKEERTLWYKFLRNYPIKFLRQKIIGNYVVDFYCAKAHLIIELDGSQHYEDNNILKDDFRTEFLNSYGFKVIRIPNNEINFNFRSVCDYIDNAVAQQLNQ